MIYLAQPFSDTDNVIEDIRYAEACHVTQLLLNSNRAVFSPIVYSKVFHDQMGSDFDVWESFDKHMISKADEVWLLCFTGWENSVGVRKELAYARTIGKRINYLYLSPDDDVYLRYDNSDGFGLELERISA